MAEGSGPSKRNKYALAANPGADGEVLLFGGVARVCVDGQMPECLERYNDLWRWKDSMWTPVSQAGDVPPAEDNPQLVFDHTSGLYIYHGMADTRSWDGVTWTMVEFEPLVASGDAVMALDAVNDVLVFYDPQADPSTTWWWSHETGWHGSLLEPSPKPSYGARMAEHPGLGVVYYGATAPAPDALDETWTLACPP